MHMYAIHTFISEALCLVTYVQLNNCNSESNRIYSASLLLLGWFLWYPSIARPRLLMLLTIAAI